MYQEGAGSYEWPREVASFSQDERREVFKDSIACSQIILAKLAKNKAAHGLIRNSGHGLSYQIIHL